MQQRWMRIGIGLFVALSLVLLGALIVLFNSLPRLFRATNVYTVRFSDAAGLSPGAAVRRSGVPIGVVGAMTLDDQTGEVNVRVELDAPHFVLKDEQPTLVASLLGGDAAIDLVALPPPEGQAPDRTPLPPGTVLVGVRAGNFNQLISRANEVVPTTQDTLNDIRKSMQRIEKLTPLVEDTFREYRDLGRSLNNSVPDLRRTNDDVDKLVRSVNDAVPQVTRNLDQLTHDADQLTRNGDQLTHDADDAAAAARAWQKVGERTDLLLRQNQDQITKAVSSLNDVLTRATSLLSDANVRNVTDTLRNVRVSSDSLPSIAHNADETLKQGPEISRNANETLKQGPETMKRFNDTLAQTDALLVDLQKVTNPFVARSEPLARNLDETTTKLNRLLTNMNQLVEAIGQSNGTFNKLLTDPSLYNNLDDAACQFAKAAPQINLILKDVETFTDKLARHPELIGIGGAIRPSSGLKDAPSPPPGLLISPQHP